MFFAVIVVAATEAADKGDDTKGLMLEAQKFRSANTIPLACAPSSGEDCPLFGWLSAATSRRSRRVQTRDAGTNSRTFEPGMSRVPCKSPIGYEPNQRD